MKKHTTSCIQCLDSEKWCGGERLSIWFCICHTTDFFLLRGKHREFAILNAKPKSSVMCIQVGIGAAL